VTELRADMAANVWKVLVAPGDSVEAGQELMILESMKMEIPVSAPDDGTVVDVAVTEGASVADGDRLITLAPSVSD
jgi:acetyl-CoA carboxylase biotin carboxyl carrier protein